jgi:hypothetical protein
MTFLVKGISAMGAHMRTVGSRRLVIELKHFREQASLTGEQVADATGWSVAKVYRIEGDTARPSRAP